MTEYAVTDPATGDVVATYPTATDAELDAALTAAAENSRTWPTDTTVADRAAQMRRVAQLHTEKREMLADIIVREMGKPRDEALGEIDFCAAIYEYYADNAEKFLADERIELLAGEGTAVIKRFPIRGAAGHHAVELPLLPGGPVRVSESLGGQHHCAQACPSMSGIR